MKTIIIVILVLLLLLSPLAMFVKGAGFESGELDVIGTWVSTVYNLDFPSNKGLTKEEYQKEYSDLLDKLKNTGINTVYFQIRPTLDSLYKSEINPWSEYLTGAQGQNPNWDFNWDSLKWTIEETHRYGMKFHAWLNPYRVTVAASKDSKTEILNSLSKENFASKNSDLVFLNGGKLYLNPGEERVRDHISETVVEIMNNYDVDGIHFDDYFYPNMPTKKAKEFYCEEESASYFRSGSSMELREWRRNNVNILIKRIHEDVSRHNQLHGKNLEFGVSPFGIWGSEEEHPIGSPEGVGSKTPSTSLSSYDNQFVDTLKWIKEGWIDYVIPQIYWTFDEKAAPYANLVDWWSTAVRGTDVKLYIGHANYRLAETGKKKGSWKNSREISEQIKHNRNYKEVSGSVFFRAKNLLEGQFSKENDDFLKIFKTEHLASKSNINIASLNSDVTREMTVEKSRAFPEIKDNIKTTDNRISTFRIPNGTIITWADGMNEGMFLLYKELGGEKELIGQVECGSGKYFFLDETSNGSEKYILERR